MKKILSMILAFAMIFSLAMPAMAAEPTVTDGTTGEVSGTYNPVIKITDVTLSEHEDYPGALKINEADKEYTVTIPADQTQTGVKVNIKGRNLEMIADGDKNYDVSIFTSVNNADWFGTSYNNSVPYNRVGTHEIKYTNDGWETTEYTGWMLTVKQNYFITNATTDTNGTVKIGNGETDLTEVAGGDKVELFVHANEGYELDTLTVTYEDTTGEAPATHQVEVAADHTFTMPKGDVTVTATFKPETVKYNITVAEGIENGTVTVKDGLTQAHAGDDVTLNVTPAEGYQLKELTVSYVENGETKTLSYTDSYTFVMPAADVTISATFEAIKAEITGVSITIDGEVYTKDNTSQSSPAVIKPDSTVTLTVTGTNFDYLAGRNCYLRFVEVGNASVLLQSYQWIVNGDKAERTFSGDVFHDMTSAWEIKYSNDGDVEDLYVSSGVWIIYEEPTYTITGYEDANGNKVEAGVAEAKEGDTVTLTVTTTGKYQLKTITVKDANGETVECTASGLTTYQFVMPASDVTVEATFEEVLTTSVEITWGSLSFTYTDGENGEDGAWSNDGSEGAGTVTVKNTGDTTVTAKATYTAEADYDEIEGIFDVASKELAATESQTFTLTLKNKPEKAIAAGTKIGSVTITIE